MSTDLDIPFLVVGAGPVGLTAARLLANAGRRCIVVERRDGSVEEISCAGGRAYTGLVEHFAAVVAGTVAPVFGAAESVRLANVLQQLHEASAH